MDYGGVWEGVWWGNEYAMEVKQFISKLCYFQHCVDLSMLRMCVYLQDSILTSIGVLQPFNSFCRAFMIFT